ncbi:hypothetical protein SUGI_1191480 [Cryptomeria japonica]|nr:hypothetical protein SUGI_1191480 [Cryptomeria japonica]
MTQRDRGLSNLEIGGDSLNVIRAVNSGQALSWKTKMCIEAIHKILKDLLEYTFRHIFRESNQVTYLLSNRAIDQIEEMIIFNEERR